MASGFFALFDDIASLMDDVAVMSKTSAKQTAGVLGDDLAVNADKAAGFPPSRELPVLWAITKGSFLNKLILLPVAFLLSAYASWAIVPILMLGGLYLAYEGVEKVLEWLFRRGEKHEESSSEADDPQTAEKAKIRSAIVTDFILSIEIVIIALGSVAGQPLAVQIPVVTLVAFLATVGVYGIVALPGMNSRFQCLSKKFLHLLKKLGGESFGFGEFTDEFVVAHFALFQKAVEVFDRSFHPVNLLDFKHLGVEGFDLFEHLG